MPDPAPLLLRVALVEDDISFQNSFTAAMATADDMVLVSVAQNVAQARIMLEGPPRDVLVVDLGLPDGSGIDGPPADVGRVVRLDHRQFGRLDDARRAFFLTALHRHHSRALRATIIAMCLGFGVATLPLIEGTPDATIVSPIMYLTMVVVGTFTFLAHILWSRRAGNMEGAGIAVCGLLSFVLGGPDMLLQNNLIDIENLFLSFYAQIALIIAFGQIMLSRYIKAMTAVAESNVVLARSLAERETELTASHNRLREIERRHVLHQERQRLMQDMHDGLGSSLVSALRVIEHGRIGEKAAALATRRAGQRRSGAGSNLPRTPAARPSP